MTAETPATTGARITRRSPRNAKPDISIRAAVPAELVRRLTSGVVTGVEPPRSPSYAPFTREMIADLPQSSPGDVQAAYETARKAQYEWAQRDLRERTAVLLRFHDLVLERQAEVLDLIQVESGKARRHAFEEVADVAIVARHYARAAESYLKPRRLRGAMPLLTKAYEQRQPRGVVGIIAPWNYPFSLAVTDAFPALVAGNGVVLKPDNQAALTGLWARELLLEAGLPDGLLQVVLGDGPVVGPAVVDHADYVCFTGSTRTGRQVGQQAAYGLVGCSLELGGKNAMLVLDDADMDRAVKGALRGCFASAGQLCISFERLLVHYSVYDAFVERFVEAVKALRLGADLDFSADMGSLVSHRVYETVVGHVEDARAKGATLLTGGRPRPETGPLFFEPTVLTGVTPQMSIYAEETFGPVVSLYSFRTEEEAVARANDTAYGLNASVWTRDATRGRRIGSRLRAGTVNVNEAYAAAWA
ncbi:MAG: succinic semialdehyde dehydrogenase, partial [Streptomycetales bacterium]